MRKLTQAFVDWCDDASPAGRLEHTIAQGVIGVIVSALATGEWTGAIITGLVIAVLSPVMAEIGKNTTQEE